MVDPAATSTKSLSESSTNQRNGENKRSHFALSVDPKIGRINSVSNLYPTKANMAKISSLVRANIYPIQLTMSPKKNGPKDHFSEKSNFSYFFILHSKGGILLLLKLLVFVATTFTCKSKSCNKHTCTKCCC